MHTVRNLETTLILVQRAVAISKLKYNIICFKLINHLLAIYHAFLNLLHSMLLRSRAQNKFRKIVIKMIHKDLRA